MNKSDTQVTNRVQTSLDFAKEAAAYAVQHPAQSVAIIRLVLSEVIDKLEYLIQVIEKESTE